MSVRPVLLLGGDVAAAARAAAAGQPPVPSGGVHHPIPSSALSSAYSQYAPGVQLAKYPEVALFSQLGQLFPKSGHHPQPEQETTPARAGGNRSRGNSDSKNSYASRHQAAEQRRRTRINERLVA